MEAPRMKALNAKERVNLIFRAFSDPLRLRILQLLRGGELCVGDLVTILRVPQPTTSRHLTYLKKAGLVRARKAGTWMIYALAPARGAFHEKILECLGCCFDEVPSVAADARRAERIRREGGCCPH
jgi:ArsR family transcriptional regulator